MISTGVGKGVKTFEAETLEMKLTIFLFVFKFLPDAFDGLVILACLGNKAIKGADQVFLGKPLGQGLVMKQQSDEKNGQKGKPKREKT